MCSLLEFGSQKKQLSLFFGGAGEIEAWLKIEAEHDPDKDWWPQS